MDGKKYFREVCKQNGIDCDTYFKIGAQKAENNAGYVYQCPAVYRKKSHIYAINYVKVLDAYIAWNLNEPKAKSKNVFRVLKTSLTDLREGQLLSVIKPIEYSGWDKETVYAFDRTAITSFLDMCFQKY